VAKLSIDPISDVFMNIQWTIEELDVCGQNLSNVVHRLRCARSANESLPPDVQLNIPPFDSNCNDYASLRRFRANLQSNFKEDIQFRHLIDRGLTLAAVHAKLEYVQQTNRSMESLLEAGRRRSDQSLRDNIMIASQQIHVLEGLERSMKTVRSDDEMAKPASDLASTKVSHTASQDASETLVSTEEDDTEVRPSTPGEK
jgi:hypothetical protein